MDRSFKRDDIDAGLAPIPALSDRLKSLRPSHELLAFYRQKISEFDGEHADLLTKLDRYKASFAEQHQSDWALAQREGEIQELQKALSDMQVYAENDRLKILELEDRKKIQHLLGLSAPVEHESTYFRSSNAPPIIQSLAEQSRRSKEDSGVGLARSTTSSAKGRKKKTTASFGTIASDELDERDRVETLKLTIEALKTQLEDKTRLSNEKITTLMEDRRIREEESRTAHERDAKRIADLTAKVHDTQNLLYDSTRDYLALKYEQRTRERSWTEEKERLIARIEELKDDLDNQQTEINQLITAAEARQFEQAFEQAAGIKDTRETGTNAYRPGGRSGATGVHDDVSVADPYQPHPHYRARGGGAHTVTSEDFSDGASVARSRDHQESLAEMYREQCIKLEDELCRLREEKAAAKEVSGSRSQKLLKRLTLMKSRYEALDRRRALESEGYKNSIKLLRKKLQDVEKQLYRLAARDTSSEPDGAKAKSTSVKERKGGKNRFQPKQAWPPKDEKLSILRPRDAGNALFYAVE